VIRETYIIKTPQSLRIGSKTQAWISGEYACPVSP
jgi:hypothetical protein